jgi:dipeptidyl aminopeptidase/acylaminoacyl peptidase
MRVVCHRLVRGVLATLVFSVPVAAQPKPTLTPADYAKWESLGHTELSSDGRWIAYVVNRVDDDDELRYRALDVDSTRVVPNGARPVFSRDGHWLAYSIAAPKRELERGQGSSEVTPGRIGIVDLRSGDETVVERLVGFDFSADSRFIALRASAPANGDGRVADLIVQELATGVAVNFGNIHSYAWRDDGALLAMVVDAAHRAGNGVRLYDADTGVLRTLESDTAEYRSLVWRRDADDLAVLRVHADSAYEEPTHTVIAWRGVAGPGGAHARFRPATRSEFPTDQRIVDGRELRWSRDGRTLYFGTREWTRKVVPQLAADTAAGGHDDTTKPAERAGVEVWHAGDVDIIPEQKVRAGFETGRSILSAWHLEDDRYVRLGLDIADEISLSDGRYALLLDGKPYERERMFGPTYRDLYAIDTWTGERTLAAARVQFQAGISPTGRYVLYLQDGHYWTYDTQSGRRTNITQDVPTSFVNLENDHTIREKPPYGTGGWTTNDASVLLHDRYDIWEVRPDGSRARNLTLAADERVRHRRAWLDPEDRIVDLSKGAYAALYGETTKKYGYALLRADGPAERLVFLDRNVSRLAKAKDADVFYYRVEGFDDSPDWFVGGPRLADARQVTATNTFQRDYAWGRSELIDFRNDHGRDLQAALFYPADFEPGRQYPMIVYFYEITSNTLHNYTVPSERTAYNPTVFTQNGYFVLRPDIVYRDRDPGVSAVAALVPAVEKVLETGMVDRERVGIIGHSWGAYQTAFAVTQTDLFRAAVAGAPLTNLISMYLSIYWNTGGTDARIFEIDQGRMEVPFWVDLESYIRNSPVFHIESMNTPLLVAFGDKDGAVEFNQGIELYNAARRAGKDMVLLVYEGENHSLSRRPNQLDYHRRINEWFGHYLKGEPAADWITQGVRHRAPVTHD